MSEFPVATGEIVEARTSLEVFMPGTAVVHTATKTSDSQGGYTWSYAAASTVAARLAPYEGTEEEIAGRIAERQAYTLTLPSSTTIDEDDRVVYNSITYEVVSVRNNNETPWNMCIRAVVIRVD